MKGGGDAVKQFPWMAAFAVLLVGIAIGIGGFWLMSKQRAGNMVSPTVVVMTNPASPSHNQEGNKLPVYPDKEPQYPLRVLSQTADFQQIGILKSEDGSEPIVLPLFGRRLPNRPDRWEYYTATDKQHMLKVSVEFESRDCLEEVGCNELYKGDKVVVPVYGKNYEVQLYKYRS